MEAGCNYSGKRLSKIQWILSMNLSLFSSSCQHRRYNIHCGGFWRKGGKEHPVVWSQQWEMEKISGFAEGLSWAHLLIFRTIGSGGAGIRISHRAVGTPLCARGGNVPFLPTFSFYNVSPKNLHPKTLSWASSTTVCFGASFLRAELASGIPHRAAGKSTRSLFTPEKCFLSCR